MDWIYLVIAILAEVVATSAMKASEGFTRLLPSVLVITGYVLASFLLSLCLRSIPVGIAYAIWSGVGIVFISVAAMILYGQVLDGPAVVGIGLILAGVLVINLMSKASVH